MRKEKAAADRKERMANRAVLKLKEKQVKEHEKDRCIAEPKRVRMGNILRVFVHFGTLTPT